mgnify:FL=1
MKHRRILSGLAALMLAASLPMSALAREWDIADGDITIVADNDGQKVSQGTENDISDDNPVIIGNSATNTVSIVAEKDRTANVTLSGANIDGSTTGNAAVSTTGEGNVSIELDGDSTLKSGSTHAGLEKNNGGSLTIADEDKNGKLTAEGGGYGAGIGGGYNGTGSDITISGGEVKATGGSYGAGIGGGNRGTGSDITISGGEVEATGGTWSAGIGGGNRGTGSNITISGGEVEAAGGTWGAGIGGGQGGSGNKIAISGGKVNATGGYAGAGIGGGENGDGSDIIISGGEVKATGGSYGAGIGGGCGDSGSDITISGGEVKATGGVNGAGIGGGCYRDGNNITVSGDAKLKVQGGVEDDTDGAGAGIGNGGSNAYGSQIPGAEVEPDTSGLTTGRIEYYAPGADMDKDAPSQTIVGTYIPPQPAREAAAPAQPTAPLYRVTDGDGKDVSYETTWRDGVLTVTVEADWAVLTGRLSGIASLQAQGIERIVFITKGATSEFLTADLLAAAPATERYALTHDGETVTFTAGEADVSGILVKA